MVLTDSFTYLFTPQPTAEGLVVPGNSSARGEAGGFSRRGALWTQALSQEVRTPGRQLRTWACFLHFLFSLFLENEPGVLMRPTRRFGSQRGSRYAFSCRFRRGQRKVVHLRTSP